jgi:hypothetical protein
LALLVWQPLLHQFPFSAQLLVKELAASLSSTAAGYNCTIVDSNHLMMW